MIVLGESVAGVIRALSTVNEEHHLGAAGVTQGVAGLAVGFALWWLYFDFVARRPSRPQIAPALAWVYLHLVMLTTATIVGVAVAQALIEHGDLTLLVGGTGAAAIALGVLELTLDRESDEPTHPILSPALKIGPGLILLGLAGLPWETLPALVVCLVALAIPAGYGVQVWYSAPAQADVAG
jgi:hypothetical protein